MAFIESPVFPDSMRYGFAGGPEFSTDIVVLGSGFEQRNQNWENSRGKWQGEHGPHTRIDTDVLIAYFRACKGSANGFRFKDWTDYTCSISQGIIGTAGIGDGMPSMQMRKLYTAGSESESRPIRKPIAATVEVYKNNVLMTSGYTLDDTTGMVSFPAIITKNIDANVIKTITNITKASIGVVTSAGHGFVTGDIIRITDVEGMIEINDITYSVVWLSSSTFSLKDSIGTDIDTSIYTDYISDGIATKNGISQTNPARIYSAGHGFTDGQLIYIDNATGMTEINGSAYTVLNSNTDYFDLTGTDSSSWATYTGGGTIGLYLQSSDTLTWAGEFDVPARFASDTLSIAQVSHGLYSWSNVEVIEIKF